MAGNNSNNFVSVLAILVIVLLAVGVLYFLFFRAAPLPTQTIPATEPTNVQIAPDIYAPETTSGQNRDANGSGEYGE